MYCHHCQEYGFKERLGPKILMQAEPKPVDYENWLQCYASGSIYPVYGAKIESKLQDFVETPMILLVRVNQLLDKVTS